MVKDGYAHAHWTCSPQEQTSAFAIGNDQIVPAGILVGKMCTSRANTWWLLTYGKYNEKSVCMGGLNIFKHDYEIWNVCSLSNSLSEHISLIWRWWLMVELDVILKVPSNQSDSLILWFNLVKIPELPGCFIAVKDRTGVWLYRQLRTAQATEYQPDVSRGMLQTKKVQMVWIFGAQHGNKQQMPLMLDQEWGPPMIKLQPPTEV